MRENIRDQQDHHQHQSFEKFWDNISVKMIAYLVGLLMAVLFTVMGYNFAQDNEYHTYNRLWVERLQAEKASKDDLYRESEKIRIEIKEMGNMVNKSIGEVKNLLIERHGKVIDEIKKENDYRNR